MSLNSSNRLYINRVVQKALFCRTAWHWCFALFAIATALVITHFFATAPIRPEVSFSDRCLEAMRSNALVLTMLLCLVPIFMRDSLRVTHRLVAPLEDIKSAMDDLARGKIPAPIGKHRAKCWEELAESINKTAARIRLLENAATNTESPAEPAAERLEEPVAV